MKGPQKTGVPKSDLDLWATPKSPHLIHGSSLKPPLHSLCIVWFKWINLGLSYVLRYFSCISQRALMEGAESTTRLASAVMSGVF